MTLNLKKYKIYKIKNTLKKNSLVFFFHITNLNSTNNKKIEQNHFINNIKCHKLYNTLTKYAINSSIISNLNIVINGSVCLIYYKKNTTDIQKLLKLNKKLPFICLKLNKKLYSFNQVKNLPTLNYNQNIKIFNKTLTNLLKSPFYKFVLSK